MLESEHFQESFLKIGFIENDHWKMSGQWAFWNVNFWWEIKVIMLISVEEIITTAIFCQMVYFID